MSYLKKKLLKEMEAHSEVIKLTRGKFEKVSFVSSTEPYAPLSAPVESTERITVQAQKVALANAAKYNEEHVWVLKPYWIKMLGEFKAKEAAAREAAATAL